MERQTASNKRIYFGLFLIAIGGFWILERLDLIPEAWDNILISWQMLLIAIGVFSLIGGNRTTGTILIVIGGLSLFLFVLPEYFSLDEELEEKIRKITWPSLIVLIGVVLLVTHTIKKNEPSIPESGRKGMDYFDDFVIFGGREVFVNSQNFYGGRNTSMFGGTEYDLRQTLLSENGAVIDCVTVFGGCGFKVPPDWTVKNEVTAVFGGFSDRRGKSINQIIPNPSKTLVVKGFTAFGGIEIKHF